MKTNAAPAGRAVALQAYSKASEHSKNMPAAVKAGLGTWWTTRPGTEEPVQ